MKLSTKTGTGKEVEKTEPNLLRHLVTNMSSGENLENMSTEEALAVMTKWRLNDFGEMPEEKFLSAIKEITVRFGNGLKNKPKWEKALRDINLEEIDAGKQPLEINTSEEVNGVITSIG